MNLLDAIKCLGKPHAGDQITPMISRFGQHIDPDNCLKEYPRPQFVRSSYYNLNGYWGYSIKKIDELTNPDLLPEENDGIILVPFSPECSLSGVNRSVQPDEYLWYSRLLPNLKIPADQGSRLLLHFDAVDQIADIYVNSQHVASHTGGFLPFTVDITDALFKNKPGTALYGNELAVRVWDYTDTSYHSRGKQKLQRGGMFYTAQSGIWQSVWLEWVPESYVADLKITPSQDLTHVTIEVATSKPTTISVRIPAASEIREADSCEEEAMSTDQISSKTMPMSGHLDQLYRYHFELSIEDAHLWSPEDPYLYPLTITAGSDEVSSYFAMRSFTMEAGTAGAPVFCLNHKPYFLHGVLDQGYWPESLLTAPSDDALVFDISEMKKMGFTMIRKHIKIESSRWYYYCDKLGMIVWQDMVNGGTTYDSMRVTYLPSLFRKRAAHFSDGPEHYDKLARGSEESREEFISEMVQTINLLYNTPSISNWTIFNEGWGQFDAHQMYEMARALDPTRTIDNTSGWFDQRGGDYRSEHNYFDKLAVHPDKKGRGFVISEYGGYSCRIDGHSFVKRVYGYKKFDDMASLQNAYHVLIEKDLFPLREQGLSGAVYTQVSDIEEEVNGILTYDRAINKITGETFK